MASNDSCVRIIWGGVTGQENGAPVARQGAAYNPAADRWRLLPESPIPSRKWPTANWTGSQVLVSSGSDLASYDPGSDRWELLPSGPLLPTEATAVWTGRELIALTSAGAASYQPDTRSWRTLPSPGGVRMFYDRRLVWTGEAAYSFTDHLVTIRP